MTRAATLRAVAFDLDGTLLDTGTIVPDSYIAVVRDLGGPALTRREVISVYHVGAAEAVIARLLGTTPPDDAVARYLSELERRAGAVSLYPGMQTVVEQLAARFSLAVYTGASARACAVLLDRAGIRRFFRVVLCGDEVERQKPDPEGLRKLADHLGLATDELAYVGDAARDAAAARACGALAIIAAWGHEYRPPADGAIVAATPEDLVGIFGDG